MRIFVCLALSVALVITARADDPVIGSIEAIRPVVGSVTKRSKSAGSDELYPIGFSESGQFAGLLKKVRDNSCFSTCDADADETCEKKCEADLNKSTRLEFFVIVGNVQQPIVLRKIVRKKSAAGEWMPFAAADRDFILKQLNERKIEVGASEARQFPLARGDETWSAKLAAKPANEGEDQDQDVILTSSKRGARIIDTVQDLMVMRQEHRLAGYVLSKDAKQAVILLEAWGQAEGEGPWQYRYLDFTLANLDAPAAAKAGGLEYTIQVASYPTEETAINKSGELRKASEDAFVSGTIIVGKGPVFRVCVGHFDSKEAAERALGAKKTLAADAFIQRVERH